MLLRAGLAEAPRRPRREAPETAEACRGARPLINCRGANFGICSVGTGSSRTVRLPFNFLSITFLSRDEEIDDANSEQPQVIDAPHYVRQYFAITNHSYPKKSGAKNAICAFFDKNSLGIMKKFTHLTVCLQRAMSAQAQEQTLIIRALPECNLNGVTQ